jgi:WD40 repeat protein/serine/threonine protein kinase
LGIDPALGDLIEEFTRRLQAGEPVGVESFAGRHPQWAEELGRLLPTLVALADLSSSASGGGGTIPSTVAGEERSGRLGDFRLVREVGRGGMGVVYEAFQETLDRRVALKILPFAAALDERRLRRFHLEATAAAQLHHPHIVPVFGVGCERGVHYYAMQFIDGRTLADAIRELRDARDNQQAPAAQQRPEPPAADRPPPAHRPRESAASPRHSPEAATAVALAGTTLPAGSPRGAEFFRTAARLGVQVAEALEHAHGLGVLHRDIKPGNLLLDGRGNLWVTDFGVARLGADGGLTLSGDLLGTVRYMSPEQTRADASPDYRCDVYSLGVTLYELLTLEPAWTGQDREQLLRQIAFEEPRPPRSLNPAIPKDLETIVLKAMAKETRERYRTAGEFAEDLKRFLEHRPIRARRPSMAERTAKWLRRHRSVATLTVSFLVLACVGLAAGSVLLVRERNAADRQRDEARASEVRARDSEDRARNAEARARARLYAAEVRTAYEACRDGDLARARELLALHVPGPGEDDRCGFEWYYLAGLADGSHFRPELGPVYRVAYSPDSSRLAAACRDGVLLMDPATGRREAVFTGHRGDVNWVSFSPDGGLLAAAADDGGLRVWSTVSHQARVEVSGAHRGEAVAVVFTPDGRNLVSGGDDGVLKIWDARDARLVQELHGHARRVEALTFSPDGKTLASASGDGTVRLWDWATGRSVTLARGNTVAALAFAPGGRELALARRFDPPSVWDVTTLRRVDAFSRTGAADDLPHEAESIVFLDNDRVAIGTWSRVVVWDWKRARAVQTWSCRRHGTIRSLAFSPVTGSLASSGDAGEIDVRSWPSRHGLRCLGEYEISPTNSNRCGALSYSPDGRTLAVGRWDGWVELVDIPAGRVRKEFRHLGGVGTGSRGACFLTFSKDGTSLAVATDGGNVYLRDVHGMRPSKTFAHVSDGTPVFSFTAAGPRVIRTKDGVMKLVDLTGKPVSPPDFPRFPDRGYAALSPDGRTAVAVSPAGGRDFFNLTDASRHFVSRLGISNDSVLTLSPDGRWFIEGSTDGGLQDWDTSTGEVRHRYCFAGPGIFALAVSPDGKTLASADSAGAVRLWSTESGLELFQLQTKGQVHALAFAGDGRSLAASATVGKVNQVVEWRASAAGRPGDQPAAQSVADHAP